ncbi:mitochondrial cardiolipin hydrolase [Silurus meridionalis]|uniref:Mitochondrial cardiolipin hydrolase n=1 Tax=Silurus meridionalis TaxID=175797 RepID=A0A8T0ABW7_SILME|nr:mitochondrial cardiolipin hydrolase [Silurus meridionalis]XP_046693592.1 mitochondrial cardiolipin hydrolase [Silurus meridionalis]XP_046693593.1 mitochondrial cardiolipin hydrolase [Silurus meridionalis]KAF7689480.1 hypothetical protein HF521_012833 [Silurus meridionalis]
MSLKKLLKMLGLGAVAVILGLEGLDWLRSLWPRQVSRQLLKEVLFFPSPPSCVEHLYNPVRTHPCPCPLPHGLDTSFSRLLEHLLSARVSLDLCMFCFSNIQLSRAVLLLHSRGVRVRVLTDREYMAITGSQIAVLLKAGICVRHELAITMHMHHKFAVLDSRKLITGSLNWTMTAVQSNQENVIVIEEPELVQSYEEEFNKLWEASDPAKHPPHPHSVINAKGLLAPSRDV